MTEFPQEIPPLKEHFIAYFDILGYRNAIENSGNIEEFHSRIHHSLRETLYSEVSIISQVKQLPFIENFIKDIHVKIFSDNVLICIEKEKFPVHMEILGFCVLASMIAQIQRDFLLKFELPIRGAITQGKIAVNDIYVFGEGLVRAVTLEENTKDPCILIDKDRLPDSPRISYPALSQQQIEKYSLDFLEKWYWELIGVSEEDKYFVNYLFFMQPHKLKESVKMKISQEDCLKIEETFDYEDLLDRHHNFITKKLKEFGEDKRTCKKYFWIRKYHNAICAKYGFEQFGIYDILSNK